eukprot:1956671-Prorocentrum_lima.AAC.1
MEIRGLSTTWATRFSYSAHKMNQWSDVCSESYIYDGGVHRRKGCTLYLQLQALHPQPALKIIPNIIDT